MSRLSDAVRVAAASAVVAAIVCLANYLISWYLGGVLGKFPFEADSLWSVRSGVIFLISFAFAAAGGWRSQRARRRS
ncbi:hypothetical protein [Saccharibacillus alkalitolerans]|uniref:Uncharacterized protein n=1 Tax=Saccharibacillus alkalitolerans TaxID=2705290 RepID=A0ABX0F5M4_9BACL|nr:hypothetical protein [Saccharibacillus alkalitolerans]NGZ76252.1 hypothetical protein [Saccharibacillus alkalitolerans]